MEPVPGSPGEGDMDDGSTGVGGMGSGAGRLDGAASTSTRLPDGPGLPEGEEAPRVEVPGSLDDGAPEER